MKVLRAVLALAWATVATLLLAEVGIRVARPTPPVQVVRTDAALQVDLSTSVPLWRDQPDTDGALRHLDCPADGTLDVVLAGDSIWYDIDAGHRADTVGFVLQRLLADHAPPVCVLNLSQPGYLPYQQLEEVRRLAATRTPDLVLFTVWKPDEVFTRVGDDLMQLDRLRRDALGTPILPGVPVPDGLRRALFAHSHLWRFASLALADRVQAVPPPGAGYLDAATWLAGHGIDAVFVAMAPLDVPFAETAAARARAWEGHADHDFEARQATLRRQVEAMGLGWVDVATALQDEDVTALRLDTCCHYAHAGHAAMAATLAPEVRERLDRTR
ncbi:MAG: hypothetical protein H6733_00700 [Alphaproteobacteria bacterium]|nr:hypothetical protein [Alphaproteobacteria bacterium]